MIAVCTMFADEARFGHINRPRSCLPCYESMPGWQAQTAGARSWTDLPAQAIKYVRWIEELVGCPVALLSTSPERDDTILVHNPFETWAGGDFRDESL